MGGGAGIQIEVNLDQFYVRRARNDRRRFIAAEQPVIAKWSALGYEDGMRDIDGDLLKAEVIVHPIHPEYTDWMKGSGLRAGDRLAAWVDSGSEPRTVIWPGYVRGKWQDKFPLSIDFDLSIEGYGAWARATVVLTPADEEKFDMFWQDVFNFIAEAEDPEEEDAMSEEQVAELHWENCEVEYGA